MRCAVDSEYDVSVRLFGRAPVINKHLVVCLSSARLAVFLRCSPCLRVCSLQGAEV